MVDRAGELVKVGLGPRPARVGRPDEGRDGGGDRDILMHWG